MQELIALFKEEVTSFPFQEELRKKVQSVEENSTLEPAFKRAWVQSAKSSFASSEDESLHEVNLSQVLPLVEESSKRSYLVFVDGVLRLDLSDVSAIPKACVILPTSKALKIYGQILTARYEQQKRDPLSLFNLAYFKEGVVIYVPAKLCVENPLQILFLSSQKTHLIPIALPRIDLILGKGSSLDTFLSSQSLLNDPHLDGSPINVQIIDGHHLTMASLQATVEEEAKLTVCDASMTKARSIHTYDFLIRKKGCVSMHSANFFSLLHGLYAKVLLDGEEGHFAIKGIATLHPYTQAVTKVVAEHKAKNTTSHQHLKQIVSAGAKSTFEGKIYVHPEALLTNAYQRSQAILLSDHAHATCRPNLEIFADDVKASHGATIATLQGDELHYLRTRGLTEEEARKLLMEGFAKEVLLDLPYESVLLQLQKALTTLAPSLLQS